MKTVAYRPLGQPACDKPLPDVARSGLCASRSLGDSALARFQRSFAEEHLSGSCVGTRLGRSPSLAPRLSPHAPRAPSTRVTAFPCTERVSVRPTQRGGSDDPQAPCNVHETSRSNVHDRGRASAGDLPGESCSARHSNKRRRAERAKADPRASDMRQTQKRKTQKNRGSCFHRPRRPQCA